MIPPAPFFFLKKQKKKSICILCVFTGFFCGSSVKNLLAMQEPQETWVQPLGQEEPLEEDYGNPLQKSCLENSMERGAWQAIIHRVAKSWTWLKQLSIPACTCFHANFKLFCSSSVKNTTDNLIGTALNLHIVLGNIVILAILILLI